MINKEIDLKITKWIDKNRSVIIEDWIALAKIPSIKSKPCEGAPFGKPCAQALEKAASYFATAGFSAEVYKDSGYALAYYGESEKTLGLFCHSDVVPVGDDWIFTKPFAPVIKNGALIGRGVEDNKSGIMASLCVLRFLKDENIPVNSRFQVFIGSDEECGMNDINAYLKGHNIPEISIVPDADFPCSKGEKGIYHFMAKSQMKFNDIVSIKGGEAFNIVLDNVIAKIRYDSNLYAELSSEISSEFTLDVEGDYIFLTAKGIAKHASIPEGSVNAALLLFSLLSQCESLCKNDREILKNAAYIIHDYYGAGIGITHTDDDFGKMTCVNGIVDTLENKLHLSFDVRYGNTLEPQLLEMTSENKLNEKGFDVFFKENRPGFSIDKNSKIPELLESIFSELTGEHLKSVRMSGGTYARKLKNAFSIGTFWIDKERKDDVLKMPDGHGGAHQCDEMIDIEGFFKAVRILIHYCLACDETLKTDF